MTTLFPWKHRAGDPVACPLCRTLDVTLEETDDRFDGRQVAETFRCKNGHRWQTTRRTEDDLPSSWHLVSREYRDPPYGSAAIHCPKCGSEAVYNGWLRGICTCGACGYSNEHVLRWPEDAYYSVEVDGKALWARTRGEAIALKDFIASDDRESLAYPEDEHFLRHIPKEFLLGKHREITVRRLQRLLKS